MNDFQLGGVGMTSERTRQRLVQKLVERGISSDEVLEVIAKTPRHIFLDEAFAHRAYEDTAMPIGYGQTISQPFIVARMTEILLQTAAHYGNPLSKVLEVGTGSGYQTAVLAQLVGRVFSVERIRPLQNKARDRLRQLNLTNVDMRHADGGFGWPERGPFDGILSAAAPRILPVELQEQLAPNGILVIPVGGEKQVLQLVIRRGDSDQFDIHKLDAVRFVPLVSGTTR